MGRTWHGRVKLDQVFERKNPTMDDGIASADGDLHMKPLVPPMKIERLIAAGGRLTDEEQARVRCHQLGDLAAVAREMGRPIEWVRQACAWDIQQRRQSRTA